MRYARCCGMVVGLCVVLGCSSQSEKTAPPRQAQGLGAGGTRALPVAGKPLIGEKPAMPEAVMVAKPPARVETFVTGLEIPWDIAFPEDGRVYVTERPGRVRVIENGKLRAKPYATISRVLRSGEGGLMGMALAPDYAKSRKVFLMYTYGSGGRTFNRVSRFDDTGSTLAHEKTVIEGMRGASIHDGGALRFGPDGMLYVGTGDAGNPESAQDKSSLSGKILRITPDGKPAPGNPFAGSPVYAYGFRNVQGLAWNPTNGDLWAANHGPSGEFGLEAMDSVFVVRKGGNHGWPRSLGVTDVAVVVPPVLWFPQSSVPPALAAFYKGDFWFASLRGEELWRVTLSGARKISKLERWFALGTHRGVYGRLRAVAVGPDGALYVSTSNRDGRGDVRKGDDRILRISDLRL